MPTNRGGGQSLVRSGQTGDLVAEPGISTALRVSTFARRQLLLPTWLQFSGGQFGRQFRPLLLPDAFRALQLFSLIVDARVAGEDNIDGRQSFRIEGTRAGLPIKLWIDKTQYLILKTYRKVRFGDRENESTVQYKPKLNAEVPPEDLTLPQSPNQSIADLSNSKSRVRLPPEFRLTTETARLWFESVACSADGRKQCPALGR